MGNIINFMEKLGALAEFQELSETEVLEMLKQQNLVEKSGSKFHTQIEDILDVRKGLICGIVPAEEPSEPSEEEPLEEEPEK